MIEADKLEPFVRKLERLTPLAPDVRSAVLSLELVERTFKPNSCLLRDETHSTHAVVVLSGFACREKILRDGSRQILSFHMRGDGIGIAAAFSGQTDYDFRAITTVEAALIPFADIRRLIEAHPQAMQAFWLETLVEAAIQREWTANIGRRDARSRIAHLLCELAERQASAGLAPRECFDLPFSQEQLGDATGLTAVHVNRTLHMLKAENAVQKSKRQVAIPDWHRLTTIAGFQPGYLQLRADTAG